MLTGLKDLLRGDDGATDRFFHRAAEIYASLDADAVERLDEERDCDAGLSVVGPQQQRLELCTHASMSARMQCCVAMALSVCSRTSNYAATSWWRLCLLASQHTSPNRTAPRIASPRSNARARRVSRAVCSARNCLVCSRTTFSHAFVAH